jgi:formylglycine-generating enzyme
MKINKPIILIAIVLIGLVGVLPLWAQPTPAEDVDAIEETADASVELTTASGRPIDLDGPMTVIIPDFICEYCDNPDFGRLISENLRALLDRTEEYKVERESALFSIEGRVTENVDGYHIRLKFFNFIINRGGFSKIMSFESQDDLITRLPELIAQFNLFREQLRQEEDDRANASEDRLRAEREAEEQRLAELRAQQEAARRAREAFDDIVKNMVQVDGGDFMMGYPYLGRAESPAHRVEVDTFYMDKNLVTNAEFVAFLNELGTHEVEGKVYVNIDLPTSKITLGEDGTYLVQEGYENHPVVNVSWYGAKAYAESQFKRLPTEAEWEYAAGGPQHTMWAHGDIFDSDLYAFNKYETEPVASYPPNDFGLYDMGGNVAQWCTDWYDPDYYKHSPVQNPGGADRGELKVLRGGSWRDVNEDLLTVYYRHVARPNDFSYTFGFRCAKDPLSEDDTAVLEEE